MPQNPNDWAAVVTSDGADDWGPVLEEQPKPKQGFKRSLRAGMGLQPEGGFWDDISQIGAGFKQMASHPLVSANDLVEGLWSGQEDVAEKGKARMRGDTKLAPGGSRLVDQISGAAQYAESGVPVVGPILSRMGEQTEEGDYTGALGTGLPLAATIDTAPARGMVGDVARTPGGALKPGLRETGRLAGGVAGMEAMPEHPYIGAGMGYGVGARLTDLITPKRTADPFPGAGRRTTPWEAPPEEEVGGAGGGAGGAGGGGTGRLSDQMSLLPEGGPKSYKLTPEQVPGLPELRRLAEQGDTRAQSELQRRGQQILIAPKEAGYPGARPGSRSTYSTSPEASEAAPARPVSKSSEAKAPSGAARAEKRGAARPKGTTLSDKMAKQFALEESVKDTTKRLKAEKDPAVKRHMQQQIDDFNDELKGLQ